MMFLLSAEKAEIVGEFRTQKHRLAEILSNLSNKLKKERFIHSFIQSFIPMACQIA